MSGPFRLGLICALMAGPLLAQATDTPIRLASLELVGTDSTKDGDTDEAAPEVTFTVPLGSGGEGVEGRSLAELLAGSPLHAPFDGLPETLWKDKACSHCHQWSRDDLCEHGRRYVGGALETALSKPHPYGGGFKQNVFYWAKNACR